MIKEIVKDPVVLMRKSEPATHDDMQTVTDLLDTVNANYERCVGMAANMIGVHKTILVALIGKNYEIMINPEIIEKTGKSYDAEEGCLSLEGVRSTKRYSIISIEYLDKNFRKKKRTLRNFEAQIVQHEMDHFNGILI